MNLKKKEYPRPNIKLKKARGSMEAVTGLFFLFFMAVLLCAEFQREAYRSASLYMEDALAASNLASAVIDIEEYGISHMVQINDPIQAFERYQNAVKENLQLNADWECANLTLISGPVSIQKYIVYNVEREKIAIYTVNGSGTVQLSEGDLGSVKAPNGMDITNTSVYSEIAFHVNGLFGTQVQAHKGKLVDIVSDVQVEETKTEELEDEESYERENNT